LEYELDSPVWRHLILGMASRHKLIRYDGRGTGLSQRDAVDISMDRWVSDLECVVDTLALERFVLLGVSQGGAISVEYAARHPERVSHLIIHGAYARGFLHRENPDKQRQFVELNRALVREGWGSEHDTYRQWFTSQFIPGGTAEQSRWFNGRIAALERNWIIKTVAILAALAGALISFLQLFRLLVSDTFAACGLWTLGYLSISFWARSPERAVRTRVNAAGARCAGMSACRGR
jgi:pimeloyl-ACP methyl ester carboxylesterase